MKDASLFEQRLVVTTATPTSVTLGGALFTDLLACEPDLDAVFCANDDLALGVLFECRRREIAVPEQIAIVGFNDLDFCVATAPALTSVSTERQKMGTWAAQSILEIIRGSGRRPKQTQVDVGFSIKARGSTAVRAKVAPAKKTRAKAKA